MRVQNQIPRKSKLHEWKHTAAYRVQSESGWTLSQSVDHGLHIKTIHRDVGKVSVHAKAYLRGFPRLEEPGRAFADRGRLGAQIAHVDRAAPAAPGKRQRSTGSHAGTREAGERFVAVGALLFRGSQHVGVEI